MKFTTKAVLIVFFYSCLSASGQENVKIKKNRYLNIGPGFNYQKIRDLGMSRMTYSGPAFVGYAGYHSHTDQFHSDLDLLFMAGIIQAPSGPQAALFKADLIYSYQRKIKSIKGDLDWLAGGSFSNAGSVRNRFGYSNNAFGFDYFSAFNLMSSLWRMIEIKNRDIEIGWELTVPLVAFSIRPSYVFAGPPPFYDFEFNYFKSSIQSFEAVSWGNYFRLRSKISINYFLKNGNTVLLGYLWEYYNFNSIPQNELWAASHSLFFATKFKL